jgi:hypothetical protein
MKNENVKNKISLSRCLLHALCALNKFKQIYIIEISLLVYIMLCTIRDT